MWECIEVYVFLRSLELVEERKRGRLVEVEARQADQEEEEGVV